MPCVTFKYVDGSERAIDIDAGSTLMEGAVRGGIDGIDADCGGALSCATCHVQIPADWRARLVPPSDIEIDMLEFAVDPNEDSRLSCQIVLTEALDGLMVAIPSMQHA